MCRLPTVLVPYPTSSLAGASKPHSRTQGVVLDVCSGELIGLSLTSSNPVTESGSVWAPLEGLEGDGTSKGYVTSIINKQPNQ